MAHRRGGWPSLKSSSLGEDEERRVERDIIDELSSVIKASRDPKDFIEALHESIERTGFNLLSADPPPMELVVCAAWAEVEAQTNGILDCVLNHCGFRWTVESLSMAESVCPDNARARDLIASRKSRCNRQQASGAGLQRSSTIILPGPQAIFGAEKPLGFKSAVQWSISIVLNGTHGPPLFERIRELCTHASAPVQSLETACLTTAFVVAVAFAKNMVKPLLVEVVSINPVSSGGLIEVVVAVSPEISRSKDTNLRFVLSFDTRFNVLYVDRGWRVKDMENVPSVVWSAICEAVDVKMTDTPRLPENDRSAVPAPILSDQEAACTVLMVSFLGDPVTCSVMDLRIVNRSHINGVVRLHFNGVTHHVALSPSDSLVLRGPLALKDNRSQRASAKLFLASNGVVIESSSGAMVPEMIVLGPETPVRIDNLSDYDLAIILDFNDANRSMLPPGESLSVVGAIRPGRAAVSLASRFNAASAWSAHQ